MKTIKGLIEKLKEIEVEMTEEKGPLTLFALLLNENDWSIWDLVTSAPWLEEDQGAGFKYVADKLMKTLDRSEIVRISRIVIMESYQPLLASIQEEYDVEHGLEEFTHKFFDDVLIERGYIITSRRESVAA